jgi:hypothetical protein
MQWYKFRNADKTEGMNELIAGILSKPLPPEPTPLTSLPPTSTPASTPTNTSGGASGAGNGNGAAASTASPAGAKPAGTPKPDKPRNRR